MEKHQDIEMDATAERLNLFATTIAEKVAELLKGESKEESKPSEEEKPADDSMPEEKEKREIDYSDFENRLPKLKR